MKDSIVVIGTHLTNYKSNLILTELINQLIDEGFDYGIVANSLVCDTHYTNSKFFIYDSENDKLDETSSANFWFENDSFKIEFESLLLSLPLVKGTTQKEHIVVVLFTKQNLVDTQ